MSRSFDTRGPPRVVFVPGAESRTATLLAELGAKRVLIVATARHRDGAERIHAALAARSAGIWDGALPQVPRDCAEALISRARAVGADWLLAHGGGTAIGAAKAAALEVPIRIAVVPTTHSGSEMTCIYGISDAGKKRTGRDERVRPALVVYDPLLLTSLRPAIRDASLMNALAHSVDAIFDAEASKEVHALAEESVRALLAGFQGERTLDGVSDALYGSHLAGLVLDRAQMALQHELAHVLGGSFGTPHAETHTVLLPHTMAWNLSAAPDAAARLSAAFGDENPAVALHSLQGRLGVPTRLATLGFDLDQVDDAVEQTLSRRSPNPRPPDAEGIRELLLDALHGRRPGPTLALQAPEPHGQPRPSLRGDLSKADTVLLAIHGRGSNAEAFLDLLVPVLPPSVATLAVQAAGDSWYPAGYREQDRNATHRRSALSALDAVFAAITRERAPGSVVVVGFSQGACLALSWLAQRGQRTRPRAVAAWSGALAPLHTPRGSLDGTWVQLSIAEHDPWVPLEAVRESRERLRAAGAETHLAVAPGDQHQIVPSELAALGRLLETP